MKNNILLLNTTLLLLVYFVVGCATKPIAEPEPVIDIAPQTVLQDHRSFEPFTPSHFGNPEAFSNTTTEQLRRLNLVATNLVAVLIQIPELQPTIVRLQVGRPRTAFGNVLIRVLEDAGFALQLVDSDHGPHYVGYEHRFAQTDIGPITDFSLSINDIRLTREYIDKPHGIFPSSLMSIRGTAHTKSINVADDIFKEQGSQSGTDIFVSGTISEDGASAVVSEVSVNPYDRLPSEKTTTRLKVIEQARRNYFDADRFIPELSNFERYRRTVLVFSDSEKMVLGQSNKQSARLLAREFKKGDLMVVKGCNDVDGSNDEAHLRAIRVEEEVISNGVPQTSIYLAPCSRTSYRHHADNSPVPVEIVHYRSKES